MNRPVELACMTLDRPVPHWYDERLAVPRFNGTYLKPLLAMIRANDMEIRRQAICALANLSDQPFRGAYPLTQTCLMTASRNVGGQLTRSSVPHLRSLRCGIEKLAGSKPPMGHA